MASRVILFVTMTALSFSGVAQEFQTKPLNEILNEIRKTHTEDEREKLLHDLQAAHDAEVKAIGEKFQEQLKEIQRARIAQRAATNIIFIGTVAVLALLLLLLYNRFRIIHATRKTLESQHNEIENKNRSLDYLNREKEWLIKEIHHRVKNNLQMMISLLNVQSEYLNNPTALAAIRESRERIETIAIIHKKLNQAEVHSSEIKMQSYINELVDAIRDCFAENKNIYFNFDIDPIALDISQAVPVGLILNEAITNAVKHAYNKDETGSIAVSLKFTGANQLQLKIADVGRGLPDNMDASNSNTLGFQLMKLFSEQLDGQIFFTNNRGLEVILTFKSTEDNNTDLLKSKK